MSRLRDLLANPQFKAVMRELEAEARRLGYKPVNGYLANPLLPHHKLRRNRCLSRVGHSRGRVTTSVVPGYGPRKYRMKLIVADPMPMYSRIQRLAWDDNSLPPVNGMCQCRWSDPRPCKRCKSG